MEAGEKYRESVELFTENGKYDYDDIYGQIFCEAYYNNTARIWTDFSANIE